MKTMIGAVLAMAMGAATMAAELTPEIAPGYVGIRASWTFSGGPKAKPATVTRYTERAVDLTIQPGRMYADAAAGVSDSPVAIAKIETLRPKTWSENLMAAIKNNPGKTLSAALALAGGAWALADQQAQKHDEPKAADPAVPADARVVVAQSGTGNSATVRGGTGKAWVLQSGENNRVEVQQAEEAR